MTEDDALWAINVTGKLAGYSFATFPKRPDLPGLKVVADFVQRQAAAFDTPGLLLMGPPGIGKTGLAVSLARQVALQSSGLEHLAWLAKLRTAVESGTVRRLLPDVWYEEWPRLADRVRDHKSKPNSRDLENMRCLVVDELDLLSQTEWREALMKRLVDRVEANRVTVFCVNSEPSQLVAKLGERIADRLAQRSMFTVLHWAVPSLRAGGD